MPRLLLLLIFLFSLSGTLFSQTPINTCFKSTEGKDFWFGFMESRNNQNGHYLEITMTSKYACKFQLFLGKSQTLIHYGTLIPNSPYIYKVDWRIAEALGSETIDSKALHLTSDLPLNLFAMNWCPSSADVALIFPTEALGNEYYAMCYDPHVNENANGNPGNGKNSEFLVVASQDNTKITITPTKVTDKLKPANTPFTITLNKGELYQVQSMNHANLVGQGDLTGSYIKSDKPVAFYSGSWSTTIPLSSTSAYDHLYEQIPPVASWGSKFVAVPLMSRGKDTYRILAAENKTTIKIGTKTTIVLDKGKFYEFMLNSNEASLIVSDKPVLFAQYSNSNDVDKTVNGGDGDPFLLIVSPVDQTREKVTFVAYDSPNISSKYFVNIVVNYNWMSNILLDGLPIQFTILPNSDYAYAQVKITKGSHTLESNKEGKGFIAYVYGFGGVESYGYNVGFNLDIKIDLGSSINFVKDTILICKGEMQTLDAGSSFAKYKWNTGNPGDTTRYLMVWDKGFYKVTASTKDECTITDSVYTYLSAPKVNLGNDTTICNSASLKLDAGKDFISYRWSNNDSTQTTLIKQPGKYWVTTYNKFNCPASDTIWVYFVPKPVLNRSALQTLICDSKTTTVKITADKGTPRLYSSNPSVVINGITATVPNYGDYLFTFTVTDPYTCAADTSFTLKFHESDPKVKLGNDTTICNPATIKLDAGGGYQSYLWSTNETIRTKVVTSPGRYSVEVKNSYGCPSSSAIYVSFTNKPKLNLSNFRELTCGGYTTTVNIKADKGAYQLRSPYVSNIIKGLTVTVPYWGTFPFIFTAKDEFSCATDTSIQLKFYKTPTAAISIDTTTCYGYSLNAKYLGDATIERSKFTWVFAKDTAFNKIGADNVHINIGMDRTKRDLSLTVEEDGCPNTAIIKEINVIPDLSFIVKDSIVCLPDTFEFVASNTENVITYEWDWGDGTVEKLGKASSHHYNKVGMYDVQLTATTDKNCVNSFILKDIVYVAPVPTVAFSISPADCLPGGPQELYYKGTGDDKDNYYWNFSAFQSGEIVKDPGKNIGPVTFDLIKQPQAKLSLQVISKHGCISEIGETLLKRIPLFNYQLSDTAGCIPFNIKFQVETNDKVDQVQYNWDFGNGSKASGNTVENTYTIPDRYHTMSLWAISSTTNCGDTIPKAAVIHVFPQPTAGFTMDRQIVFNDDPTVNLTNQSLNADNYIWDFGDETISYAIDPVHKYQLVGPRNILLEAINTYDCSDTISHQILIALSRIYTPNAFSPTAPNPADRLFRLDCNGVNEQGYHLKIISRWNDVVFELKDEKKGWDGKMKNGMYAPAGNYFWMLDFIDFMGKAHRQNGSVTLVY